MAGVIQRHADTLKVIVEIEIAVAAGGRNLPPQRLGPCLDALCRVTQPENEQMCH